MQRLFSTVCCLHVFFYLLLVLSHIGLLYKTGVSPPHPEEAVLVLVPLPYLLNPWLLLSHVISQSLTASAS